MTNPRIQELTELITQARHNYYNATPLPSGPVQDDVYDAWVDELAELESDNVAVTAIGAPAVSAWPKAAHRVPMGSLNKVNLTEELMTWVQSVTRPDQKFAPLLVSEKMDGISCFDGTTPVLLANGEQVTIQEIVESGQTPSVLSWDPVKGFVPQQVLATHNNGVQEDWLRLTLADGSTLLVTSKHLFYVKDKGWVQAQDLLGEDILNA